MIRNGLRYLSILIAIFVPVGAAWAYGNDTASLAAVLITTAIALPVGVAVWMLLGRGEPTSRDTPSNH